MKNFLCIFCLVLLGSCNNGGEGSEGTGIDTSIIVPHKEGIAAPIKLSYNIIEEHPHDTSAYTQGLQLFNGKMYEGTGDFEASSLRITDYKTGKVEKIHKMGTSNIFGEGITILNGKLYQLTWQSNIVYVYDLKDISKPTKTFQWASEGWGITNNGKDLIVSDGVTSNIYFVDPETFKVKTQIAVADNNGPVDSINELEFINGFIFANIYTTNDIVKIDPESGHIVGKMNFDNLVPRGNDFVQGRTDYFNGIAYDSTTKTIFVTGKRWPKLYEIRLN